MSDFEFFDMNKEYEEYNIEQQRLWEEEIANRPDEPDVTAVSLEGSMENTYIGQGMGFVDKPVISKEATRVMKAGNSLEYRRVMLINTVVGTGSVGRLVAGLYDTLEEHGYECMVAYGRGEAPEGMNAVRIGSDVDMYIHGAISRAFDRHGFGSAKATRGLVEVIEEFDPDIVHLHNVHGYYINLPVLFDYLKASGRRIIWTLHDCWTFTGHCAHFEYVGCTKWLNGCDKCEQLDEYPKSMGKDNSKRNYEDKKELFTGFDDMTLVAPSNWLKGRIRQSFMQDYNTVVVPTGIDLSQFRPIKEEMSKDNIIFRLKTKMGIRSKRIILGVANPWRERKGLNQFETLAKAISDRYAIILVGLNDDQLSELPDSIIGIAKTDSVEELAALYSMADVYVNLTLEDTFPTTNIEALACGTPVVTYKAGGSPESIDDTCGITVDRNSIQGVIAALDKISNSKDILYTEEMCVRRARLYDKEVRFLEYIQEVYEGMV